MMASTSASAADHEFRVLHHEAVQIATRADVGQAEHMTFDAYGRRFSLALKPNERIRRALPASRSTLPMLGAVEGIEGSWVRITRSPSGWRGMIFDGEDYYAVEPAEDVAGVTVQPLTVTGASPVVYRLRDALLPLGAMSCEIANPASTPGTAAAAMEQISAELQVEAAALTATKQVRVGVVGDYQFVQMFSSGSTTPEDAIVARMNIVDGIFTSQLGLKLSLAPSTLFRTSVQPFSSTNAETRLGQVRDYRWSSPAQLELGLTHLMTGVDLDGETVGIAYLNSVCDGAYAAGLSQGDRVTTSAALIAAHEIGHNFNAPHDGEAGACVSTPPTFLMAPRLNGNDQFSRCSIDQIQSKIATASCLRDYVAPDAALEIPSSTVQATVGTAFATSVVVRAMGDDASNDVSVSGTLPTSLTIQSASANGGTCTMASGSFSCSLGALASGDTRQVDLTLNASEQGSLAINFSLSSSNDASSSNNSGTITVASTSLPTPPATTGSSTSSGGGGGRIDFLSLTALVTSLFASRRRNVGAARAPG